MKKWFITIIAFFVCGFIVYSLYLLYNDYQLSNKNECRVLIVYNKVHHQDVKYVMDAYQSVMTEEGIPWEMTDIHTLSKTSAKQIIRNIPAIIFPDALLQTMPEQALVWVKDYLNQGGSLAVIYDAGIRDHRGHFRKQALLSDIVGINYITYSEHKDHAYVKGQIKFKTGADAAFFQIPPGKISDNNLLSGYVYGGLNYPVANIHTLGEMPPENIFAHVVTEEGEKCPAVVLKRYGQGNVLYINLPLGYLKAYSDDLPLRVFLRTFLFQTVKIPHLINTNQGTGKLVINWHIDSNSEWKNIDYAVTRQYLDHELRSSIHITAGDFRDEQGDGLGFDACRQGRNIAKQYLPYGVIGSHGGWAHNWFADQVANQRLTDDEIKRYVKNNKTCLESIAKYPLLEYSAPEGVHPQPVMTNILENLGFNSYYYTGDSGSAPNRTFSNGKMVSGKVIAFPVLPNGKMASLYEMKKAGLAENDAQKWLTDLVDYVIDNRTTRLFYSHLNDTHYYPQAMSHFFKYAKLKQTEGKLQVEPMSDIARFFQRFIITQYTFRRQGSDYSILLKNAEGLKGITVAIPRHTYRVTAAPGISQSEDKDYYFLTVQENVKEKNIAAHGI